MFAGLASALVDSPPPWAPGWVCPAGAFWDNTSEPFGATGFAWTGEVLRVVTHIGNPFAACQSAGGDGLGAFTDQLNIGYYYTLCNAPAGCGELKPYTSTIYGNVTGTHSAPGALSGLAQAPVEIRAPDAPHAARLALKASGLDEKALPRTSGPSLRPVEIRAPDAPHVARLALKASGLDEKALPRTSGPSLRVEAISLITSTGTHYSNPFSGACKSDPARPAAEANVTLAAVTGAICAPACDPKTLCPTDAPPGTTAVPQCVLAVLSDPAPPRPEQFQPSNCALMCDPASPSGGASSRCPAGATCKSLYGAVHQQAGAPDTGVCTFDARP